jgi:hypothetical protein
MYPTPLQQASAALPHVHWSAWALDGEEGLRTLVAGVDVLVSQLPDGTWCVDCDGLALALRTETLADLLAELRTELEDMLVGLHAALDVEMHTLPDGEVQARPVSAGYVELMVRDDLGRSGRVALDADAATALGLRLVELATIARRQQVNGR